MKVLVADARPPLREGLRLILRERLGVSGVEEAGSSEEFLHVLRGWTPDVAIIDADLPATGAGPICDYLRSSAVRTIVLIDASPKSALDLIEVGVQGIAVRGHGVAPLLRAVQEVMRGHSHVPADLLGGVLQQLIERRRSGERDWNRLHRLSQREQEVLALLATGLDHRQIAQRLEISQHTAKTHIKHVLSKLEVRSRIEAAALAADLGLISEPVGVGDVR